MNLMWVGENFLRVRGALLLVLAVYRPTLRPQNWKLLVVDKTLTTSQHVKLLTKLNTSLYKDAKEYLIGVLIKVWFLMKLFYKREKESYSFTW
jgi:hypothetical protein